MAVATCRALPELDRDGPQLIEALKQAGVMPEIQVWDDPAVNWSYYDLALVRSTWDYTLRRQEFLDWAARSRRIANPSSVLLWNTDKSYLREVAAAGVPVVPTEVLNPREPLNVPPPWMGGDIVVKPTVSASAADTARLPAASPEVAALVERLHLQKRAVMIQPYLTRVDADGETALVYLGGHFSHAVRKAALLTQHGERLPLVGDEALDVITPTLATAEQQAVARAALSAVPGGPDRLSYARVDVVPDDHGRPVLLELELTEPSLFLQHAPAVGLARFAAHVAAAAA